MPDRFDHEIDGDAGGRSEWDDDLAVDHEESPWIGEDDGARRGEPGRPKRSGLLGKRPWIPLVILGVLIQLAFFVALKQRGFDWNGGGPGDLGQTDPAETEKRVQRLRRAFGEDHGEVALPAGVRAALETVVRSCRDGDAEAFRSVVDFERMTEEIRRRGATMLTFRSQFEVLRSGLAENAQSPWLFDRYHVAHVERAGDDLAVYGYFFDEATDCHELCWRFSKANGPWRIYDYELLQHGASSVDLVLAYVNAAPATQFADDAFDENLAEAEALIDQWEIDRARPVLTTCRSELRSLPAPVRRWDAVALAYSYYRAGLLDEAVGMVEAVDDPRAAPGVYFIAALAEKDRGNTEAALAATRRYEAAMGGGPVVHALYADVLLAAERIDEAKPHLRAYLEVDPGNVARLRSYGDVADADDVAEVVAVVKRSADPAETAYELGQNLWSDEHGLRSALATFLREERGDPVRADYLTALDDQARGRLAGSARLFRRVFESTEDEELREAALTWYWSVMLRADRVVDAYEASPDKARAFRYLGSDGEEDGSFYLDREPMTRLAERRRRDAPRDPYLLWYDAQRASEEQRFDDALAAYDAALEEADSLEDWERDGLHGGRAELLVDAGRWQEAYAGADDPDEAFVRTAGVLRRKEMWDELRDLVDRHRRAMPQTTRAVDFEAALAEHRGDYADADRLLARAMQNVEEPWQASTHRWQRIQLRADGHLPPFDYAELAGEDWETDEVLRSLVNAVLQREDHETAEALLAHFRRHHERTPVWWELAVTVAEQAEDDVRTLRLIDECEIQAPATFRNSDLRARRVAALSRVGRHDEAVAEARRLDAERNTPWPLARALILADRPAELKALAEEGRLEWLDDGTPGIRERLLRPEFAPVRKVVPTGVPALEHNEFIVALAAPREPDAEALRAAAADVFGADVPVDRLDTAESGLQTYLVAQDPPFYVTFGTDAFADPVSRHGVEDGELRRAWNDHTGWYAVGWTTPNPNTAGDDEGRDGELRSRLVAFEAKLRGDDAVAFYDEHHGRVRPGDVTAETLLASESAYEGDDTPVYLFRESFDSERRVRFRQTLPELRRRFADGEGADVRLRVDIGSTTCREPLWLTLERIERSTAGFTYVATPAEPSRLVPWLRPGELLSLSAYEIADWSVTLPDGTTRTGSQATDELERQWAEEDALAVAEE